VFNLPDARDKLRKSKDLDVSASMCKTNSLVINSRLCYNNEQVLANASTER
jgi:hypothetical protein